MYFRKRMEEIMNVELREKTGLINNLTKERGDEMAKESPV